MSNYSKYRVINQRSIYLYTPFLKKKRYYINIYYTDIKKKKN